MKILFIGDIVGKSGRQAVTKLVPVLKQEISPDIVIANGENSAGGMGITKESAHQIFRSGVDIITLGNHVWAKNEVYPYLDEESRIIRPANYPGGVPGRGHGLFTTAAGEDIGVISLCGRIFMDYLDNPFLVADKVLGTLAPQSRVILVDFHGEATSEKHAFAWYLDGRVTAIIGTHTHVQTADEQILPGGTAFLTDVGMTGPKDSVIGIKKELSISRFVTQLPSRFIPAEGDALFCAAIIDADSSTGKATHIERIQRMCSD